MKTKHVPKDVMDNLKHAIAALLAVEGVEEYSDVSQILRQTAQTLCRSGGISTLDTRTRPYRIGVLNVWDVSRGLDDPVSHKAATEDELTVHGLRAVMQYTADTLAKYFRSQSEDVPPTATAEAILKRERSFRCQMHENGGKAAFRVRWEDTNGAQHIAIVSVERAENE